MALKNIAKKWTMPVRDWINPYRIRCKDVRALIPLVNGWQKMNSKTIAILVIFLFFFVLYPEKQSYCCTIVMASRDGNVLVGNNEDRTHFETVVSFIPSDGKNHGVIMFGYDDCHHR